MIGKFIAPAGAGTPSEKGIYLAGRFNHYSAGSPAYPFNNLGLFNSDLTPDYSFNPYFTIAGSLVAYMYSIVSQPDGKLLVAGAFTSYLDATTVSRVLRLNADLTLDTSFVTLPTGGSSGISSSVITLGLQADGKIIAGGFFSAYGVDSRNRILRMNSDGSLDTSFSVGTGFNNTVRDVAVQSDGKILVCGDFTTYNGVTANRLVRLNSDGTIDSSFNIGSGFDAVVNKICVQPDGKILVAGNFTSFNGVTNNARNRFLRLEIDGTFDSTFSKTSSLSAAITDVKLLSNGDIIIAGGPASLKTLRRYSPTAVVNTSFESYFQTGAQNNWIVNRIQILDSDRILATGSFSSFNGLYSCGVVILNSDGSVFRTFPKLFASRNDYGSIPESAIQLPNGKFLIGGGKAIICDFSAFSHSSNVLKLDNYNTVSQSGNNNSSYIVDGAGFLELPRVVVNQRGERYINGIRSTAASFLTGGGIRKFRPDGQVQQGYNGSLSFMSGTINDMVILPDGSKISVGSFTFYRGNTLVRSIVKEDIDDIIDDAFIANSGTGFGATVFCAVLSTSGKIYVGGNFSSYNGVSGNALVRLNVDGTRDGSFGSLSYSSTNTIGVVDVAEYTDGRVVAVGSFAAVGGTTMNGVVRINPNGTRDTTFSSGTGFSSLSSSIYPRAVTVQSTGKIVIVGEFSSYNGVSVRRIVRLNVDGSIDSTFNSGTGFDATPYDIVSLSDGKMIIVGDFVNYNGNAATRYCVLDQDGNLVESNIHLNISVSSIYIRD
jgi:uncharacterized delta-60 repeat protein